MFNENKAVRIAIDNQWVACVRVVRPRRVHNLHRERITLAVFLAKSHKEHIDSVQMVMEAVKDIQKALRERYHSPVDVMVDFHIPMKQKPISFSEASKQWFGGTAVPGSASVPLLDDASKPLY